MSPRVIPKTKEFARHLESEEQYRARLDSYTTDRRHLTAKHFPAGGASPYSAGSEHSFFRDSYFVALEDQAHTDAQARGLPTFSHQRRTGVPDRVHGDVDQARARLAQARDAEARDITTGDPGGVAFMPAGSVPAFVADELATAARATSSLAGALRRVPLPESGMDIRVPRFDVAASAAVQASQGAAVAEVDPDTTVQISPVAFIAGVVDASVQLLERAEPGLDGWLAAELGAACGAAFDAEVIQGTAASGRTRGLTSWAGILTRAFTSASPTVREGVSAIWGGYSDVAGTAGVGSVDPDRFLVIVHPRRAAWLHGGAGDTGVPVAPTLPGRFVASAGVPTTVNTTQDEIYVLDSRHVFLAYSEPRIQLFPETGSATLTARLRVLQQLAVMVRQPAAVVQVRGTGLAPPTL